MNSIFLACRYGLANVASSRSLIDSSSDFDLTLTSHTDRVRRVFMAIESACSGLRPARVILYLAKEDWNGPLPTSLLRLKDRGLEIRECENLGPHKKQQGYLSQQESFERPLVTIDDDVFYAPDLLERLRNAWNANPHEIHCSRARRMLIQRGQLMPYRTWPLCDVPHPSHLTFPTGVGGVIYPPSFLARLKAAGDGFKKSCPFADDIWVHCQAVTNAVKIRQLTATSARFPDIPGSRRTGLFRSNLREGGNDRQLLSTFSPELIAWLGSSGGATLGSRHVAGHVSSERVA